MPSATKVLAVAFASLWLAGCPTAPPTVRPPIIPPATHPTTLPAESPATSRLIGAAQMTIHPGASEEEVLQLLGAPSYAESDRWTYVADDPQGHAAATIRFAAGKVAEVKSSWSPGWQSLVDAPGKIACGAGADAVRQELGEPIEKVSGIWYTYYPDNIAPSRIDLFFEKGNELSWGSLVLLSRLKKLPADLPAQITNKDVVQWLGQPAGTVEGEVWTYTASGGSARVKVSVYFRGDAAVKVQTSNEPVAR